MNTDGAWELNPTEFFRYRPLTVQDFGEAFIYLWIYGYRGVI